MILSSSIELKIFEASCELTSIPSGYGGELNSFAYAILGIIRKGSQLLRAHGKYSRYAPYIRNVRKWPNSPTKILQISNSSVNIYATIYGETYIIDPISHILIAHFIKRGLPSPRQLYYSLFPSLSKGRYSKSPEVIGLLGEAIMGLILTYSYNANPISRPIKRPVDAIFESPKGKLILAESKATTFDLNPLSKDIKERNRFEQVVGGALKNLLDIVIHSNIVYDQFELFTVFSSFSKMISNPTKPTIESYVLKITFS